MKGKFFGYVQEKPCTVCNSPRVGADCDDNYSIFAGMLHPVAEPTCTFPGWTFWGKWKTSYSRPSSWNEKFSETIFDHTEVEPTICPLCGGAIHPIKVVQTVCGSYGRSHVEELNVWKCENASKKDARMERLQGCPHCVEYKEA